MATAGDFHYCPSRKKSFRRPWLAYVLIKACSGNEIFFQYLMQALQKISHIKLFTTLGACSGSWHLPVASTADEANHEHLTTLISANGCCCFNMLPFSIRPAPEHFQRNISHTLETVIPRVCATRG